MTPSCYDVPQMKSLRAALGLIVAVHPLASAQMIKLSPVVTGAPVVPVVAAPFAAPSSLLSPSFASPFAVAGFSAATTLPPAAVPAAAVALKPLSMNPSQPIRPSASIPHDAARPASAESASAAAAKTFDGSSARSAASDSVPVTPVDGAPQPASRLSLPVTTFKLKNGLTVVVHTDKTAPVVAVSVTYKVGSQHETPGLSGFAHLFEHLMAQGTKSLKPREISRVIESNGGVRNAYTMRTNTTYHSVVPKSALKTVLWAEAERMSTLNVDERALALEQQVVLEEMRLRYVNQAYAKARDAGMAETAFAKWENQHTTIGEAADVRNAKLEDVRAFYKKHYAPNNAVLSLAGDVDEAEARELAERFYGHLEPREIAPAPDLTEAPIQGEKRRVIEDKFAKVPLLMTGWNAPERGTKDYWALTVLAEVLGGGEESPLYQSLVKDAKIALGVSPNYPWWTGPFNPGGPDLFGFMTQLKPGASADVALRLTDAVLARYAAEGPAEGELASAKAKIELSWTKDLEQLIERAKTLGSYAAMVGDPSQLSEDFAALTAITAADVREAVSRWLIGKGRAVVEARPTPDAQLPAEVATPAIPAEKPREPGDPRPEIDAQRAAPVPLLTRFSLSNGFKVVFARDSRLPLLEARLSIPSGRVAELAGEEGLSAAVSELLLQGAAGQDAKALSAAFGRLGWKLEVGRGMESLSVDAVGLARNAGEFFKNLAQVLSRPDFAEDEVTLWKENKAEELKISRSKPDFMSGEKVKAELFGSHPYGRPALTDAELAAITREKIAAYGARTVLPQGATLVLTGDADPEVLRAQLEAAFSGWTGATAAAEVPALPAAKAAALSLLDRPGSKQANLNIAQTVDLRPGDADYLAFSVMNQILGGSATSRLFVNLRVDKGYTYGSYARVSALEKGLLWTATAETRNEVARPALDEMRKEILRMRDEAVPAETLEATKRYLAGIYLLKLASIDYQADSLAGYERTRQSAEREYATYLQRLNALTPEDIQRVARKYLNPEAMATVVVGDEAALRGPLTR